MMKITECAFWENLEDLRDYGMRSRVFAFLCYILLNCSQFYCRLVFFMPLSVLNAL